MIRLFFNPSKVQQDYQRAGVPLPDTFAAYLRKPWDTSKPRAETRGAA